MKYCEFYKDCRYKTTDTLCTETYELCKLRKNLIKFRVRLANSGIEEEVLDMINLNGYVGLRR